jgi:hypothetical protein
MPITRAQLAALQHRLGVAAEAEGRVDQDGALVVEGGRQEGHDPVQEDRDVAGCSCVGPTDPGA